MRPSTALIAALPASLGASGLRWIRGAGAISLLLGRSLRLAPRMNRREFLRGVVEFGYETLPLTVVVAAVTGAMVVLQTSLYVERFGARALLGWAAGHAVLWEFGPLLLGMMMAARVGARNAAELATLRIGGQIDGLSGISLDPIAILVAPRIWAVLVSVTFLAVPTFLVAVLWEVVAAWLTLDLPVRVFLQSFADMLSTAELAGGAVKSFAFAWAIALVSTSAGLSARGGSKAVGRAAANAVVLGAASIFALDFVLSSLLARVPALGGS